MTPTDKEKQQLKLTLTTWQRRQCDELQKSGAPYAGEVADQFSKGRIDVEVFPEIHEILQNPNKMARDQYKNFMKALAKGRFPNRGKNAVKFLKSLEGPEKEADLAKDILKELSREESTALTQRKEKSFLKELTDLRQESVNERLQETAKHGHDVQSAITHITASTEVPKPNWQPDKAPEKLVEELNRLQIKQAQIAKKANGLDTELRKVLKDDPENKTLIAKLENGITALDSQFDELVLQIEKPQKQWLEYLQRCASQYQALENFFSIAGVDIRTATKIRAWLLDVTNRGADEQNSLKLQGVVIDRQTGRASKKEGDLEIVGVRFEREKGDETDDSPGELMIEYRDENGKVNLASCKYFLNLINGLEAYEEIDSLEAMEEKIREELGFTGLMEGQEFSTTVIIDFDEEGKPVKENRSFKIRGINTKTRQIELDQNVLKTPRQWIPNHIHPGLYFDRRQQKFSYGEFAKLVKQHNFRRKIAYEEADTVIQKVNQATAGTPTFTLPKTGTSADIIFIDENGRRVRAKLSRDSEGFTLEENPLQATGTGDFAEDIANGAPLAVAAAPKAKLPFRKRRLDTRALMEAVNKGHIASAQPAHAAEAAPDTAHDTSHGEGHGEGHDEGKKETISKGGPKIFEEALPYADIYKVGGMSGKKENYLAQLWKETRILSVDDLWEMGKAMYEYYDNRFTRRQKEKYSHVGEELPFWAPEMRRINQQIENEQVHNFQESFEHKGEFEIRARMQKTRNLDELKAACTVLAEKGIMRWDDLKFWKNLNRFVDPHNAVPIPSNGDPYTRISDKDERTGFDFLKRAIDSLWGEGQYNHWYSSNKSTFQSNAQKYFEEGKELEQVEGGHQYRLETLLKQHKNGEFVDPHEYEGLILHSIQAGKSTIQTKLYFMIEGVAAENHHGETILSFDRMAHFNSEMLARFPILEYLCAKADRMGPDGKIKSHRFTKDDYKKWIHEWFDKDDHMNCKPTQGVNEFLWKYVIPSDDTQNRVNKALRHADQNLDHDDMFAYLPPATEEIITDTCKAATGSKKFLTLEGYANAFPGFSQYLRSTAESNLRNKLKEGIISWVRFEGIMTSRFEKEDKGYQRMGHATLNGGTIVSDTPPQAFISQTNTTLDRIMAAYNDPELNEIWKLVHSQTGDIWSNAAEREKQNKVNFAFKQFGEIFSRVVKHDNGEKMTSIIASANFEGMPYLLSDAEKEARKAAHADATSLE